MKNFEQLLDSIKNVNRKRLAVVAADEHAIEAAIEGRNAGFIYPIFIGDISSMESILNKLDKTGEYELVEASSPEEAASMAVQMVREEKVDMILKGHIDTAKLLKPVVNKDTGIGTGATISHMALLECPAYHKLFIITDGGMVTYPTLEQKKSILESAVKVMKTLGVEKPKVACLAAVEKPNPKLPETLDGQALAEMAQSGEIKDCVVAGPISFDLAFNKEAALLKEYESEVAGDPDIMLVPDFVCGNILSKSIIHAGKGRMAGLIVGAKVPILLTSRASSAEEKYLSLAFAVALEQGAC
ncbi:MAG: bifunctional enoyl-CoA hydratase/phosphate acetyltransferase [Tissierellia bacterium]|nr:bifunctional enoyl-CoA hydratase/phosphate acetyltransferase [Tissierellia bacterium]